jgi:hypothetical protein
MGRIGRLVVVVEIGKKDGLDGGSNVSHLERQTVYTGLSGVQTRQT